MSKRIAIVDNYKCDPTRCAHECIKFDPINRSGGEGFRLDEESGKATIGPEVTSDAHQICAKKCPFEAIKLVRLPQEASGKPTLFQFPNCAKNLTQAQDWWGDIIGQVDSTYYDLQSSADDFYQRYNTSDNIVNVRALALCNEEGLRINYTKGGCYGDSSADVIRPSEQSLMNLMNCPVMGSVNRRRAEQVLALFSGD